MPEIWLNYGITDVVLDIKAENLQENVDSDGDILTDDIITQKLLQLDISKPIELVVLNNTKATQKIISSLFTLCEQKSKPIPRLLADKKILNLVKAVLPQGSVISEFSQDMPNANLVFLSEMELDGLFGFETIATRLVKKFGQENMLSAYAKRKGNLPTPCQITPSMDEAKTFVDTFEIIGIEVIANSKGIVDIQIGHPSSTISKSFESTSIKDIGKHKTMILSTGKHASNDTLGRSLCSLWNSYQSITENGLAVLVAECNFGLGSDALEQFIEGRLELGQLRNPTRYIDGMENLLYLTEIQKKFQIALVSLLPELYAKKLDMISLPGIKHAMDYILKTQGMRQKVLVVSDAARVLLR